MIGVNDVIGSVADTVTVVACSPNDKDCVVLTTVSGVGVAVSERVTGVLVRVVAVSV